MVGERRALSTLARISSHFRCSGDGLFGRKLVFRGVCFQLFKIKGQLIDQTYRAL